jgi:hypothetical protein
MFFRRQKQHIDTFEEKLKDLAAHGFAVQPLAGNSARVSKLGCAAIITDSHVGKAGIVVGDEIGWLVDGGYQKFFLTPSGKRVAALAGHLKALHDFQEDLREGLGLESLYNQALGTTCDLHLYDRVQDRDCGMPKRPWEP